MPETIVRLSDRDRDMIATAAAEIVCAFMSMRLDMEAPGNRAWVIEACEKIRSRVLAAGDATPVTEDCAHG